MNYWTKSYWGSWENANTNGMIDRNTLRASRRKEKPLQPIVLDWPNRFHEKIISIRAFISNKPHLSFSLLTSSNSEGTPYFLCSMITMLWWSVVDCKSSVVRDGIVHRPSPTVSFQKINAEKTKGEGVPFCWVAFGCDCPMERIPIEIHSNSLDTR